LAQRRTDLHGLLVVDKPVGPTSMDVVRRVRGRAGGAKTGHAGTLDPLASGVLVCCLGRATRAVEKIMPLTKVYDADVDLSAFTATDDAEGEREEVPVADPPTREQVRGELDALTGEIEQTPPAYSAVKVAGRRAYDLARKGRQVTIQPRIVRIDSIELHDYDWPHLRLTVTCGKGTYLRSLARQIGAALGAGGHLTALRRTAIGPYTIDCAIPLDDVPDPLEQDHLLPMPDLRR